MSNILGHEKLCPQIFQRLFEIFVAAILFLSINQSIFQSFLGKTKVWFHEYFDECDKVLYVSYNIIKSKLVTGLVGSISGYLASTN